MSIGLSLKYTIWLIIMVNKTHLYKYNIIIFVISVISILSIMNWSLNVNMFDISLISYNIVGLYIVFVLDILIWICLIYERYYIKNTNNFYLVIYYILNLIYFSNNIIFVLCLLYEFQSIPLVKMINNIKEVSLIYKKGLTISNILLLTYSIISGLLLYNSMYNKNNISYGIELVLMMIIENKYVIILCILISGCIKLSIFPFHIWLGKVHVEAPTIGSILLAGISLKTGFYLNYLFISYYSIIINIVIKNIIYVLLIGIIVNSVVIYYSIDGKRWIALYSIIHMNAYYIILLVIEFNWYYYVVLIYGMIGHSLISSALFLLIGYIYDISNNKNIMLYSIKNISNYFLSSLFIILLGNSSFPLIVLFIYEILSFITLSIYSVLFSIILCILSCSNLLSSLFLYYKYFMYNNYISINISYDMIVVIISISIISIICNMGISSLLPISLLY